MELINLGLDNLINKERIVAVAKPDSAPIRRLVREYEKEKKLIDLTRGRRARSVIVTDAGYLVLSSLHTRTLASRFLGHHENG